MKKSTKSIKTTTKIAAPVKPASTPNYYFNMAHKVYFGNVEEYTLYRDMSHHPYHDVESTVALLNEEAGYIMPVDDDYCEPDEEE